MVGRADDDVHISRIPNSRIRRATSATYVAQSPVHIKVLGPDAGNLNVLLIDELGKFEDAPE